MRQTASLVVNPITVDSYAFLFNCTGLRLKDGLVSGLGPEAMSLAWPVVFQLMVFFSSGGQWL